MLCVFIPIFGMLISSLFGRFFGRKGVVIITTASILMAGILAWFQLFKVSVYFSVITLMT